MSVADGFAALEVAVVPGADRFGQLSLLAPWRDELDERTEAADPFATRMPAEPSVDRRAAAVALSDVIRLWRALARELEQVRPDSFEQTLLEAQVDVLRRVHQRLFTVINRA